MKTVLNILELHCSSILWNKYFYGEKHLPFAINLQCKLSCEKLQMFKFTKSLIVE